VPSRAGDKFGKSRIKPSQLFDIGSGVLTVKSGVRWIGFAEQICYRPCNQYSVLRGCPDMLIKKRTGMVIIKAVRIVAILYVVMIVCYQFNGAHQGKNCHLICINGSKNSLNPLVRVANVDKKIAVTDSDNIPGRRVKGMTFRSGRYQHAQVYPVSGNLSDEIVSRKYSRYNIKPSVICRRISSPSRKQDGYRQGQ
jgi:hypothetical protein